jgi:hypothetical protein
MPTYDEINLTGMDIDNVDWGGSRLQVSFGHGYGAFALTGNPAGLHHWKISDSGVLPDRAGTDYGPIGSQSRFDYYYEFFKSHTTGAEEIFIIAWRGKKYHACFTDAKQSYERFTEDLFSGGVDIEQRRVAGFVYNADGSIDSTPPSVPVLTTLTVIDAFSINVTWTASTDPPGQVYTLAGYDVRIDGTTIIDAGNVLSFTYGFFSPATLHQFEVRSYDGGDNRSAWSNALSGTTSSSTSSLIDDDDGEFLTDFDGTGLIDG